MIEKSILKYTNTNLPSPYFDTLADDGFGDVGTGKNVLHCAPQTPVRTVLALLHFVTREVLVVIVVSSVNQLVSQSLIVIEILAHTDVMEELDIRYIYHLGATENPAGHPDSYRSVLPIDFVGSVPSCRSDDRKRMPAAQKKINK